MKFLLVLCLMISCASAQKKEMENSTVVAPKKEVEKFVYNVKNIEILNGKLKFVNLETDAEDGFYKVSCNNQKVSKDYSAEVKNKQLRFYLPESYFSKPHQKKCYFQNNHILNVVVKAFPYKRERLNVPKRRVDLNKKDLARVIKEKEIKKHIYDESAKYFLFDKPFRVPLQSKITSYYGNQTLFNNKKKSQHLANDLRAAVGVPIKANNRGRVVFTGDLFFSGKIVVIDHGLDLFTVYMHLSKILVEKGNIINQDDIVGHAGMTGRVSGPHLHWGVKLNGHWLDGFALVKESKKHIASYELEK